MHRGYTKSWRKKYEGRTASRGLLYLGAMDWFVGNANWKDNFHDGQRIERGQIFIGRKMLSGIWRVSEQTVRTILANLQTDGFLTIRSTNRGSIVTVLNYDIYQSDEDRDQPADQPAANQRPTTTKELKNEKNNINNTIETGNPANDDLFPDGFLPEPELPSGKVIPASVLPFSEFWDMYGHKIERKKCEKIYAKLSEPVRATIKEKLPLYVASTPDVNYRKHPQTWLNGECWNDEIHSRKPQKNRMGI